ncbi:MAG: hypothetical protein M1825_006242 [Sarcosagium campestre]|nr:MAG: hypothetical protein M1825_006242 [Sarcosagium campestre]
MSLPARPSEKHNDLLNWAKEYGAIVHGSLEVVVDDDSGAHMRVKRDTPSIDGRTVLLACPHALSISYLNAIECLPFVSHSKRLPDAFIKALSKHTVTVFFLCQQYLLRDDSFWWPYLRTLIPPEEGEKLGTPLWFSETDKQWFRGTNMKVGYEDREKEWHSQWAEGVRLLQGDGWSTERYTWRLALWAATILSSRSFGSQALVANTLRSSCAAGVDSTIFDESFSLLYPVIDILNHSSNSDTVWDTTKLCFSVLAGDTHLTDSQPVNISYGSKSNEELLMGYGFTIPDNRFDHFVLLMSETPLTDIQRSIRSRQSTRDTPIRTKHPIRSPPSDLPTCDSSPLTALGSFPHALLDSILLLVANQAELAYLSHHPTPDFIETFRDLPHATYRLISDLLQTLHEKLANLMTQSIQLDLSTPTEMTTKTTKTTTEQNARNGRIYLKGQHHILTTCITSLRTHLNQALQKDLYSLERAIAFLSPRTITHFHAGFVRAFGTAEVSGLRDAGWEEVVWALWLCALLWPYHNDYACVSKAPCLPLEPKDTLRVEPIAVALLAYYGETYRHGLPDATKYVGAKDYVGTAGVAEEEVEQAAAEIEDLYVVAPELLGCDPDKGPAINIGSAIHSSPDPHPGLHSKSNSNSNSYANNDASTTVVDATSATCPHLPYGQTRSELTTSLKRLIRWSIRIVHEEVFQLVVDKTGPQLVLWIESNPI